MNVIILSVMASKIFGGQTNILILIVTHNYCEQEQTLLMLKLVSDNTIIQTISQLINVI